ncbi:MAG: hypothetical protein ACI8Q1_003265 [Parvicella sp.]|jgi:hypothetical protein
MLMVMKGLCYFILLPVMLWVVTPGLAGELSRMAGFETGSTGFINSCLFLIITLGFLFMKVLDRLFKIETIIGE